VVPLAKGLASGVPVGACVVGGRAKGIVQARQPRLDFGGNPLAMTGVVATIDTIKEEGLLANAAKVGQVIRDGLKAELGAAPKEIRGMGLMIGMELGQSCGELVRQALEAGLVINVTADNVVRLLPPLVMSEAEGRMVVERSRPLVRAFLARSAEPTAAAR
jgi:acetylornithine aminotransferase